MEDKFTTFLNKYNGKFVEVVDSSNYAQCFDLAIQWCIELGLPSNIFAGLMYAYEIWSPSTAIASNNFEYILNTPDAIAQVGDLIVWGKTYGPAGHVAICTTISDINHFQAFSQNDPTGQPAILKDYNYNHVLGWLRYKGQITQPIDDCPAKLAEKTKLETELRSVITRKDEEITSLKGTIADLTTTNLEISKDKEGLITRNKELIEDLAKKEELRAKYYEWYNQTKDALDTCKTDRATFQRQLTECQNKQDFTVGELLIRLWNKVRGIKI